MTGPTLAGAAPHVIYRSPVPGARYVRPETEIVFRFDQALGGALPAISVQGSRTGPHGGRTILAESGREMIFHPATPFAWGETVQARMGDESLPFTIASMPAPRLRLQDDDLGDPDLPVSAAFPDTLPLGFPAIQVTTLGTPAPGRIFMTSSGGTATSYLLILENSGDPFFYRAMPSRCADFKIEPNGLLSYFDNNAAKFIALDSAYTVVDSFACGNGYTTDAHDIRFLPDGHVLLMSYDPQVVDMSTVVPGGNPAAVVTGCVIQLLDSARNVVFQWRSWDHFQITDATHEDLTAAAIDYVHGNALEFDADGNIILSSRHMDEITKIDSQTGDILWRWGGKHDQFTWSGDTLKFSHQHAIRRLPNGNFTLFDNGNFHTPQPFSRGVEYAVDESLHTAQLVWQYRHNPDVYGNATGYVERLANGNTLIAWGTGKPNLSEVTSDGQLVMEMSLPAGQSTYRAYKLDWQPNQADAGPQGVVSTIKLSPSAPNPFRGTTEMFVSLAQPSPVTVEIYDVQGKRVETVLGQVTQNPGVYRVDVNLQGFASGVYWCQVVTNQGTRSQGIVHLN